MAERVVGPAEEHGVGLRVRPRCPRPVPVFAVLDEGRDRPGPAEVVDVQQDGRGGDVRVDVAGQQRAGDASHAPDPTNGFGLVSGAMNSLVLAEALGAVIKRYASEEILDQ
jgi:hypothetical protein